MGQGGGDPHQRRRKGPEEAQGGRASATAQASRPPREEAYMSEGRGWAVTLPSSTHSLLYQVGTLWIRGAQHLRYHQLSREKGKSRVRILRGG